MSKVFATDLDGTLTPGGEASIGESVRDALESLKSWGWVLVLATGRDRPYLLKRPDIKDLFHAWIMEAGLSIYIPSRNYYKSFASIEWLRFIDYLKGLGWVEPKENTVSVKVERLEDLRKLAVGWGFDIDFKDNKGNIVLLPRGVDKAFALRELMEVMGLDGFVVAVGDSEVDLELMNYADFSAAVANADEEVKAAADYVTRGEDGEGILELVEVLRERFGGQPAP